MEITQQERLDLTDKQVISEKEAYTKSMDIKEIMKQSIPDLLAENQKLKAQLDREIHINRKMKSALEKYADPFNDMQPINELAKQVLKEINNKE